MIAWLIDEEEDEGGEGKGLGLNIECGGLIHMFVSHMVLISIASVKL
jgi:hypothetical protein